jgi:hypothetical protein
VQAGFVVDKVGLLLEQDSDAFGFFAFNIIPSLLHINLYIICGLDKETSVNYQVFNQLSTLHSTVYILS